MSDSAEGTDVDWIFYRLRPEWKDIEPIFQNDGDYPVVQIAYSEKFRDIYNYFRAILAHKEVSERAFELTTDAADINPSNYTVWHYRRILLKELNKDLNEELEYCQHIIEDNPKNYQIWHHRQVLVEWLQDPSKEKKLTERVLFDDAKNYHAWQHRQWVIKQFNLWEDEMDFIKLLLEQDIRNNSAWNQRFFIVSRFLKLTDEVISQEIKYTLSAIQKAPNNESPWNYLRGILQDKGLSKFPEVTEFTDNLYSQGCRSPHLLGFIIDGIEENLLNNANEELCLKAIDLCNSLATKHDKIRKEYWNFVARNLGNLYGPEEAHSHVGNASGDST
ncbi:protein farnesyltransferase/geranylgeranyltransferase type-1 subunit alpha-like [Uloborus diversus]|uniref:protein farnesyltransferase/geranylgeranyltransferase type-1 subunit alpha-like n=1 Tax=Uloborus diversus TaxID=327109 RepID=UPI00240A4B90|nr:protein farnesyltransferase/geranylgeranyltransferase type-1 subunit alpha-like [Uloborus diversus]